MGPVCPKLTNIFPLGCAPEFRAVILTKSRESGLILARTYPIWLGTHAIPTADIFLVCYTRATLSTAPMSSDCIQVSNVSQFHNKHVGHLTWVHTLVMLCVRMVTVSGNGHCEGGRQRQRGIFFSTKNMTRETAPSFGLARQAQTRDFRPRTHRILNPGLIGDLRR